MPDLSPSHSASSQPASPQGSYYNAGPVCLDCLTRAVNYSQIAEAHGHDHAIDAVRVGYGSWGADALITEFPILPGVNVDLPFERRLLQNALIDIARHGQPGFWAHADPMDRAEILSVIDPGDAPKFPGEMAWRARMYLTEWAEHDVILKRFLTDKTQAKWLAREVDLLASSAIALLRQAHSEAVGDHSTAEIQDAVRYVYLIALAMDDLRCDDPASIATCGVAGVPALATTACSEVLHQMLPHLRYIGDGAFLFWLAHITMWAGLNGGADAWLDTAIGHSGR